MFNIIKVNKENYDSYKNSYSDKVFNIISDIDGNKYLFAHGKHGFIWADDGIGRTSQQVHDRAVFKGMINEEDTINVCCCYGAEIQPSSNVNIINNTNSKLFAKAVERKNDYIIIMYSDSIVNKAKAAAAAII